MIGILITLGVPPMTLMMKHWDSPPPRDYPTVRKCMPREFFELLYCRFIHCSDGNAPPRRLPNGEDNPEFDSKWHIRREGCRGACVPTNAPPSLSELKFRVAGLDLPEMENSTRSTVTGRGTEMIIYVANQGDCNSNFGM